jgi:multicomponent Na+:H+ antiporter subunit F
MTNAYQVVYIATLSVLSVLIVASFFRAVKGPTVADRIVSINMIGTQIIIMICVIGLFIDSGYLADVALIYAMISFLAVVVLTKIFMGVFLERQAKTKMEAKKDA